MTNLAGLREELDGELFVPDSPGYEALRRPANPRYRDVHPRLVIRCGSVVDVALGIGYARDTEVPIVPRGGGHCFAGRSSTDGIVLDLTGLDTISVADDGFATISASVGIAGLTLGGGIGLLGRKHGLTCDRLVGARVVLADRRIVDCDADREPELFWAPRGAGGGQFGVVTSLIFDSVPEPMTARFELRWSRAPVEEMVAAWQRWAPGTPDEVTANLTVVAEPGQPPQAILFGTSLQEEGPTRELLQEFCSVAGGSPEVDVRGGLAYDHLKYSFEDLDPREEPVSALRIRSEFFTRPMRTSTIDALLSTLINGEATGRRQLTFTALGGAYNRVPGTATAFVHRRELFFLEHIAGAPSAWVDRSWEVAHVDGSGGVYPNLPGLELDDWARACHAGNYPGWQRPGRPMTPTDCSSSCNPSDRKPLEQSCLV
jgi:FAD binding domain